MMPMRVVTVPVVGVLAGERSSRERIGGGDDSNGPALLIGGLGNA
jgi:hypothetical protein